MKKKSTIVLPTWLEPIADRYARDYVEEILNIEEGSRKYDENFKKAKYLFCKDYHEANTGIKIENPTTRKAGWAFDQFDDILFKGDKSQGFLGRNQRNPDHALMASRRLKADIVHLAHIYLEFADNMNIKKTDKALSDFEYRERTGNKEIDEASRIEINTHRFKRIFVVTALLSAIESVFRMPSKDLDLIINKAIRKIPVKALNNTGVHYAFTKALKDYFRAAYSGINVSEAGIRAVESGWEK